MITFITAVISLNFHGTTKNWQQLHKFLTTNEMTTVLQSPLCVMCMKHRNLHVKPCRPCLSKGTGHVKAIYLVWDFRFIRLMKCDESEILSTPPSTHFVRILKESTQLTHLTMISFSEPRGLRWRWCRGKRSDDVTVTGSQHLLKFLFYD